MKKVNEILNQKSSHYRVADIELSMGILSTVTFGVRRVKEVNDGIINKSQSDSI